MGHKYFTGVLIGAASLPIAEAAAQVATPQVEAAPTESAESKGADVNLSLNLDAVTVFSDNIFATRNDKVDDFIFLLEPGVRLSAGTANNSLVLRGEGAVARYAKNESEDYEDWLAGVDGQIRLTPGVVLIGGGDYQWTHESRTSPEDANGVEPTLYERGYAYAGALFRRKSLSARLGGTLARYRFDDTVVTNGVIGNDDRDRLETEVGARIGLDAAKGLTLFVQGARDQRDYERAADDFGFDRDSDGYSLAVGVRSVLSNALSGEIYAGLLRQNYDDVALRNIRTVDFGGSVDWKGSRGLAVALRVDRRLEETTLPGSPAYIFTDASLSVRATPHPRLSAGLAVTGGHYDYEGVNRSEFIAGFDVWTQYWLNKRLFVGIDYGFAQRTSNAAGFDFNENRVLLRVGSRLKPRAFGNPVPALPFVSGEAPAGAYAAAFAGYGALTTGLEGPRGAGTNTADFGDAGASYGGAIGYGFLINRMYLGFEFDGSVDGPEWEHESNRIFSARRDNSFGGAMRIGYVTANRDLIYGRFGAVSTEFVTNYLHAGNEVEEHARARGLGFGVGTEAAATGRTFVRAEYVVNSYKDYDIATGQNAFDNFSNLDSQFRIGAGVRTSAVSRAERTQIDFSGLYAGIQLGHGALTSVNTGVRTGGVPLDVMRNNHGPLIGAFAGAGAVIDRVFVGAEIDVDVSDLDWNIERDPTGRVYSVEHEFSYGAGVRAGLLLGESALLYSRVGVVRTRFDTDFETTNAAVESRLTETGFRYGGGLEVGLEDRFRLRLEYSRTDYGDYEVAYGSSTDGFDNSEVVFRVGLLRKL